MCAPTSYPAIDMIPRMIVIDLDGTLLDPDGRVPESHRLAVHRAREQGAEVIVATGRNWTESRLILREIGAEGVMIGAGGAILSDARDGRTLDRETIPSELVRALTGCLLRHGHLAHLLQDHAASGVDYLMVGTSKPDPATAWWLDRHDVAVEHLPVLSEESLEHTIRVGTVAGPDVMTAVVSEMEAEFGDLVCLQHWPAVVESAAIARATHLLEVFNVGVDKWSMIEKLMSSRSIGPESVVAIGDGLNDVTMVRSAGRGIAMGQADSRVRAVADHVVACNATGGCAEAIDSVLGASDASSG